MDSDGQPIDWYLHAPAEVTYRQLLKQNVLSNSSALVRKELYAKHYAIGDGMHEDFAIWLSILKEGKKAYVMTRFGFTQEALAFESKVSESTIGRYRNGKVESFSEKNVVALCVAMHLPPWLSFALIAKAGFSLAATKEQLAHLMILNCMYMRSIDEVNEYLRERGNASLSRETAQDCRAS